MHRLIYNFLCVRICFLSYLIFISSIIIFFPTGLSMSLNTLSLNTISCLCLQNHVDLAVRIQIKLEKNITTCKDYYIRTYITSVSSLYANRMILTISMCNMVLKITIVKKILTASKIIYNIFKPVSSNLFFLQI